MEYLKILFSGVAIGIAEIIPGVSGGTIAVMMGIYDKMIGAISNIRKEFKKSVLFLLPLVIGMGISLLAFSHLMKYLLATVPMIMNLLFLGLVLGIVPMLCRKAGSGTPRVSHYIPFLFMTALMVVLAVVGRTDAAETAQVATVLTLPLALKLAGCGFIAAVCMIIPGISGSMMMVIFGMYNTVIAALTDFNIPILLCAGVGMLCGVLFGAKLIDYGFRKFPQGTYYGILGLVIGSAFSLFNNAGLSFDGWQGYAAIGALVLGIATSLFFTSDKNLNATAKK